MTHLLLFIDITWDNLYLVGGGAIAALVVVGGLATAIKSIRGEIWTPVFEKLITPRRKRRKQMYGLVDSVAELTAVVQRIEAEVKTNGGHSLKDTVNRIDRKTEHIFARVRHLDETSVNAIFEMDATGNITFANSAFCEIFDADEHSLLFRNWISRARSEDQQRLLLELKSAIENKFPLDSTASFRIDGKAVITVRLKATPNVRSGGELLGFFGTASIVCD
jgi:PAS domain S-box-containing protein